MRSYTILLTVLLALYSVSLLTQNADASSESVKFLDSYWGSGGVRMEASPGDLFVPFTVVLGSGYESDTISNIRGRLRLPDGITSTSQSSPTTSSATYLGSVAPGGVFELTFNLNLDGIEGVGEYRAELELFYDLVGGDSRYQLFEVPMNVVGKAVLEFTVNTTVVKPGTITPVGLSIINKGTASASDLRVSIISTAPNIASILGGSESRISRLGSGESRLIPLLIYTSPSGADSTLTLQARVSYRNTVGQLKESIEHIGLRVAKPETGDIEINLWLSGYELFPDGESEAQLHVVNRGSVTAYMVRITFIEAPNVPVTPVGSEVSWFIESLAPSEEATFNLTIRASRSAATGVFQLPLSIEYRDGFGNVAIERGFISVVVAEARPKASSLILRTATSITAGNVERIAIEIENGHEGDVEQLVIGASSKTAGLTILGTNNWVIDELKSGEAKEVLLELYASPEIAGSAASISLRINYLVSETGEVFNERRDLGFIVNGYIKLRIYDLRVVMIGGEPVLTGNLLNEGNVKALFTTISLELPEGSPVKGAEKVFIGDLNPNAPLPFNIRLSAPPIDEVLEVSGKLIINYKDELRREFVFEEPTSFSLMVRADQRAQEGGIFSSIRLPLLIAPLIAITAILGVLLRNKRRRVRTYADDRRG